MLRDHNTIIESLEEIPQAATEGVLFMPNEALGAEVTIDTHEAPGIASLFDHTEIELGLPMRVLEAEFEEVSDKD